MEKSLAKEVNRDFVARALLPEKTIVNVKQGPVTYLKTLYREDVDEGRKKIKKARIRPYGPPTAKQAAHRARMQELRKNPAYRAKEAAQKKARRAKNKANKKKTLETIPDAYIWDRIVPDVVDVVAAAARPPQDYVIDYEIERRIIVRRIHRTPVPAPAPPAPGDRQIYMVDGNIFPALIN